MPLGVVVESKQSLLVFEQAVHSARILQTVSVGERFHQEQILVSCRNVICLLETQLQSLLQPFREVVLAFAYLMDLALNSLSLSELV